jgi:hypothetical protein
MTIMYLSLPNVMNKSMEVNPEENSLYVFALDWEEGWMGTLEGQYDVNVNGVDYNLTPSNIQYISPCDTITQIMYNDIDNNYINNGYQVPVLQFLFSCC